jgi:hypothetical protein
MSLCRRQARFRQQLLPGHHRVVHRVAGRLLKCAHLFDAVQVINEDVRIHQKRSRARGHLRIPGHGLQERLGGPMIHLPEAIHVCETIDGLRLPHAEAPHFRRNGLGEEAVNHVLRDALLFADTDRRDLAFPNEAADGFG